MSSFASLDILRHIDEGYESHTADIHPEALAIVPALAAIKNIEHSREMPTQFLQHAGGLALSSININPEDAYAHSQDPIVQSSLRHAKFTGFFRRRDIHEMPIAQATDVAFATALGHANIYNNYLLASKGNTLDAYEKYTFERMRQYGSLPLGKPNTITLPRFSPDTARTAPSQVAATRHRQLIDNENALNNLPFEQEADDFALQVLLKTYSLK